jgi:Ricin-type beta-trefoil lectin domain-like
MKIKFVGLSVLAACGAALLTVGGPSATIATASAHMQQSGWVRIENRWEPGSFLNVETGLASGPAARGWHSADWALDRTGDGYVRIRNRWMEGQYLHIENGGLEVGPVQPGWLSAQWTVVQAGEGYVRFRNSWQPDQYIHIENGMLDVGPIQPGWHSAMWKLRPGG